MAQNFLKEEGIVLKVIPFRDYDVILVVFTANAGLIKLLVKGARSPKRGLQSICTPLIQVDVVYLERRGEIFFVHEISLKDPYSSLKERLLFLQIACEMLRAVEKSQMVGKPSPKLYKSLQVFLKHIPFFSPPEFLLGSFLLKILIHEGVLNLPLQCLECGEELFYSAYQAGPHWYCEAHRESSVVFLPTEELHLFYRLASIVRMGEIVDLQPLPSFVHKLIDYFEQVIRN